jgi:hypothetical protein
MTKCHHALRYLSTAKEAISVSRFSGMLFKGEWWFAGRSSVAELISAKALAV